ncbi:MAG: phenylalanine--tRNA ligase subunit alpha, partial [Nitrososphaerales archaeon]
MAFDVRTLHEIERKIIKALANGKLTLDVLTQQTGLNVDQVRRGIEWLKYKNLISVKENIRRFVSLGVEGQKAVSTGLPERKLVNTLISLGGTKSIPELRLASIELTDDEFNAAVSNAMLNQWISRGPFSGLAETLVQASQQIGESKEERLLKKISSPQVTYDSLSKEEVNAYQLL